MLTSSTPPPYPTGWYAVAPSRDLAPGELLSRTFFGKEIVVYRTASGAVCAVEAWCPHLGAHFGKGGRVEGELLRCPFHGFQFDRTGTCVKGYDGVDGTIKANLGTLPTVDLNGWVLIWGDLSGRQPGFTPPAIELDGWTPLHIHEWTLSSHPQEITENSVDVGHFGELHGYEEVTVIEPVEVQGSYLTAHYQMRRSNPFSRLLPSLVSDFRVHVWGLGYSQVDIRVQNYGFKLRLFVLPQPMDNESITLRIGMSTQHLSKALDWLPDSLPTGLLTKLINYQAAVESAGDVADDFDIWNNKTYIGRPSLARGDGPIGRYRAYCRQFYVDEERGAQAVAK